MSAFFFGLCLLTVGSASEGWDYTNTDEWGVDYPNCAGETQSPININYDEINFQCPATTKYETLLWSIRDFTRTYEIENNGHALEMIPYHEFWTDEAEDRGPIAVLQNNFVTESGEHKNYCLNTIHIHWGSNSEFGSEHTVNEKRAPMEMHFVHYSCDYESQSDALAADVQDPYVLAVVSVLFKVGETNEYFTHITNQIDYLTDVGEALLITNADLSDLIPLTMADFFYYEGSLTTPGCDPVVRWHILAERIEISEEQLELLRTLHTESGDLDNNFRPIQDNVNSVYFCSSKQDISDIPEEFQYDDSPDQQSSDELDDALILNYELKPSHSGIASIWHMNDDHIIILGCIVIGIIFLIIGLIVGCYCLSPTISEYRPHDLEKNDL